MATNVVQFNREVEATNGKLRRIRVTETRKFVLNFVSIVGSLIPVKTGHAKNNIIVSVGGPDENENFNDDGNGPLDTSELVRRGRVQLQGLKFDSQVYVNFNAPYTSFLNNGHSKQAAAGFIDAAAAVANAFVITNNEEL